MQIIVNSKPHELPEKASVADLIEHLKLGEKKVAVEVNTELVTKTEWKAHLLRNGDKVEVVTFVGGG